MTALLTPTHPLLPGLHFGTKGKGVCSVGYMCMVQKRKRTHLPEVAPM